MFVLFVFFLLDTSVTSAEKCPEEKRVGDTCYTRVAMTDTHQYGCMENCTYKKTNSSDTGLYCFKTGSLQVTECGSGTCVAAAPFEQRICILFSDNCNPGFLPFYPNEPSPNGICPCVCIGGVTPTNEELTKEVTCGDGQKVRLCNECPDNEAGCTSDDCEFLDGKCEPKDLPEPPADSK